MSRRILVCGASGQCGGSVIETLRRKGAVFRAGTRQPDEATRARPGFDWVRVDYEDSSSLDAALEDVDALFLVTPYVPESRKIEVAKTLIGRAKNARVARIVTVSSMNSDLHADSTTSVVEQLVEDSGAIFTHLRPNWYMQNYHTHYLASIRKGVIDHYVGEAKVSLIDARDIGAVGATVLLEPGHENKAYALTGGEALDHHQVAALLSAVTGREIRYTARSHDDTRLAMRAAAFPESTIEYSIETYRYIERGECARISPIVSQILGRAPIRFEEYARDHVELWRGKASC
jgi:uncharacterized protein YbjT (DUF2867 family)